ncbi:MAG: hypothetical protein ACFE98_09955 [Candidatus Hermodarchaeota archaeon]
MLKRDRQLGFILLMTLLICIPLSLETKAKCYSFIQQGEFEPDFLLPSPITQATQISSRSIIQQQEVVRYLTDNWDISEFLNDDLTTTIEIICQAITALNSIKASLDLVDKILSDFDLVLTADLANSKESLDKTDQGLFYIIKDGDRNVSTRMNLWIAKALLALEPSRNLTLIEMAQNIMNNLELFLHEETPAAFFRHSILLDATENPIPGSISPIATLQDQLMAMIIYQQLSYKVLDEIQVLGFLERIIHLENMTTDKIEGFLDYNLSYNLGLDYGFLHAERDQSLGMYHYRNQISWFFFIDGLYLLEYYFNQIKDFNTEADREIYDFFDPILADLYQEKLIRLLTDIQVLFRHENTLYLNGIVTYEFDKTGPIYPSDRIYIGDQFALINLLSQMTKWFSLTTSPDIGKISFEQLQRLLILLWDNLNEEAYKTVIIGGHASNNIDDSSTSGYFYAFYSVSLGLFLFDNTTQGSLIKANIQALNGLGSIFPFQLLLEFNNPITVREEQSLLIQIVPENNGTQSSGLYFNTQLVLIAPLESINAIIANPTLSVESNYSTRYNFTVSTGGTIKFTIHLLHKQVGFFTLEASFLVLRSLTMNVLVNPAKPIQEDQIKIYLEIRDEVGILRKNVQYYAIIQSDSWKEPLWYNKSLYTLKGENPIILDSRQTKTDLYCFFLAHKDGYYPAETNITIYVQTKLNFLVEWLAWLFLESDMGAWIGTIAAITALVWGLYIRIFNRLLRRVKTCHYCGSNWKTKYPVCAHCGRVLRPNKLKDKFSEEQIYDQ